MIIGHLTKRLYSTRKNIPSFLKDLADKRININTFDSHFIKKWDIVSAPEDSGSCIVELKVDESLLNFGNTLHGGVTASLVDIVTTLALFNTPQRKPGVSVDLSISYLRAAKLNDTILIEGKVLKSGGKLAFLKGNIYVKDNDSFELKPDKLIAVGKHTKFIV